MSKNPSSSSPSQNQSDRWFVGCLVLLALIILVGMVWFMNSIPKEKEYIPPDRLELTTTTVPLSRQVLVLVTDAPGSGYTTFIKEEVKGLAAGVGLDQQICLFQEISDQMVMPVSPWCSAQVQKSWWVLPEIKPAPYADEAEEQAYLAAQAKLKAELEENLGRAQVSWEVSREANLKQVDAFLWQLSPQSYRSLAYSLNRLMSVRNLPAPVCEVYIYSPMVDSLFGDQVTQTPDLNGAQVHITVLTPEGEGGLTRAKQQWETWLSAGKPQELKWSYFQPTPEAAVKSAVHKLPVRSVPAEDGGLPMVWGKPRFPDRTNIVQGEERSGDPTNVMRKE